MLGSHTESRPSTDRSPVDNGYDYRFPQQTHQSPNIPSNAAYAPRSNGYGPASPPRQRNGGHQSSAQSNTNLNGGLPPNADSRNGRDRNRPQDLVARDRSQARGTSTSKRSRICAECGQQLTGQFVRALDATYHLECFTCRVSLAIAARCHVS